MSGRQAQVKVVRVETIATDLDLLRPPAGPLLTLFSGRQTMNIRKLITLTLGGLALQQAAVAQVTTPVQGVGTTISIIVEQLEFGPVLDVIPYVSADGYTGPDDNHPDRKGVPRLR